MAADRGLGESEPLGDGAGREASQRELKNLSLALRQRREIDPGTLARRSFHTVIHRNMIAAFAGDVIHRPNETLGPPLPSTIAASSRLSAAPGRPALGAAYSRDRGDDQDRRARSLRGKSGSRNLVVRGAAPIRTTAPVNVVRNA